MRPAGLLAVALALLAAGRLSDKVVLLWLSVAVGVCAAMALVYDVSRPRAAPDESGEHTPPPAPDHGAGGGGTS